MGARTTRTLPVLALACIAGGAGSACDGEAGGDGAEPVFPADVETAWHEARGCRFSQEHDLSFIRVFVDEAARVPYERLSEEAPYPAGATLVKCEYETEECATPVSCTAMAKLGPDADEQAADEGHGWRWQRVDPDRTVVEDGAPPRCTSCHVSTCKPPQGYDLTCAEDLD